MKKKNNTIIIIIKNINKNNNNNNKNNNNNINLMRKRKNLQKSHKQVNKTVLTVETFLIFFSKNNENISRFILSDLVHYEVCSIIVSKGCGGVCPPHRICVAKLNICPVV